MVCPTHRQSVLLKTTTLRKLITIVFVTKLTALDSVILSESLLFKKPSFLDQTLSYKAKHRKQNVIHLSLINLANILFVFISVFLYSSVTNC